MVQRPLAQRGCAAASEQLNGTRLATRQHRKQRDAGVTARSQHLPRRALGREAPAHVAALGPEVDHPVGLGDDVQVTLNDDCTVVVVDEAATDPPQVCTTSLA